MYENKIIGIWGLGKVGKATAHFFAQKKALVIGMDKQDRAEIDYCNQLISEEHKEYFFDRADYLVASPGIDIRPYHKQYVTKWITELDIFGAYWKKPIIAITGSVGKTTITHLLSQLLAAYGAKIATGGNIGTPMLDLIEQNAGTALLEVSSFQLEYCTSFAPDLALWTNFAPNHLDRHTLEEYFLAKTHIFAHQTDAQKAIVPLSVFQQVRIIYPHKKFLVIVGPTPMEKAEKESIIQEGHTLFCVEKNILWKCTSNDKVEILDTTVLPTTTFTDNWIAICTVLDSLGYDIKQIPIFASSITIPEHRMEKIIKDNITFYNDSKSTTPTSTLSAVERLANQDIILFLGGLSKGIDRSALIQNLQGKVERVYCFGKEASLLHQWCTQYAIPSSEHARLDDAFRDCMRSRRDDEIILFSPSGSSYDLFKDYQERGAYFKQLIMGNKK